MPRSTISVACFVGFSVAATPFFAFAGSNPAVCDEIFGLSSGTITLGGKDSKVMSAEVCQAYKDLMDRYTIGSRSAPCISTKAQGITGLNPDFAVALNKMLKSAPMYIGITSALRPAKCQGSKNPNSNHIYGCAVDLQYDQNSCGSAACQWIEKNAATFGIQIRMKYGPEWNHIEPTNVQTCRANGPGGGIVPGAASPSALSQQVQSMIRPIGTAQTTATPAQSTGSASSPSTQTSSIGSSFATTPTVTTSQTITTSTQSLLQDLTGTSQSKPTQPTSSPVSLNRDTSDTGEISSSTPQAPTEDTPLYVMESGGQQTFASSDLAGASSETHAPELTGFANLLEKMKTILLKMLDILHVTGKDKVNTEQQSDEYAE